MSPQENGLIEKKQFERKKRDHEVKVRERVLIEMMWIAMLMQGCVLMARWTLLIEWRKKRS